MDAQFSTAFTARLKELTGDLRFYNKPTDSLIAPQIVETMLPARDADYKEAQEMPCVRWAINSGAFSSREPQPFTVVIYGGIYANGTIAEGTADILQLLRALGRLPEKRGFDPYLLKNKIPFTVGDPGQGREGLQPHPYYWVTLNLEFTVLK